jgi:CubicO group peptidase (beta-lactamase class C family)
MRSTATACLAVSMAMAACAPSQDATVRPRASEHDAGAGVSRAALERVADSVFAVEMAAEKLPGGVFVWVQNGRVVLAKGYGVSDLRTRHPVSPDSTLWRIGSISKVMTAAGVVQLADRGRIRLDGDVNDYLRSVKVPATYPETVTPRHLVTHTAGFDELPGRSAPSREAVLPLGEFLRTRLVRVRQPGRVIAYSSFAPALAGALIEDVSGLPFETYLERNLWHPLGMHDTNVHPRGALPAGYGVRGDSVVDATWEWSHTAPAGMVNSTAADMGRFIGFMLGHHPRGRRVLGDAARRSMLSRQFTTHPQVPGMGLGFQEARVHGRVIFEHGGDIDGYASLLVLLPEEGSGFFVATHREGAQLRYALRKALLDRFYGTPEVAARRMAGADLAPFTGEYRWNIWCRSCANPWRPGAVQVTADGDSALKAMGERWVPVAPLLFQTRGGRRQIGFARDSAGQVWQFTLGGAGVMERVRR